MLRSRGNASPFCKAVRDFQALPGVGRGGTPRLILITLLEHSRVAGEVHLLCSGENSFDRVWRWLLGRWAPRARGWMLQHRKMQ
jgi:hypothetical protein